MDVTTREDLEIFREELAVRLESIRRAVTALGATPAGKAQDTVNELFRQFHSLKSAANLLNLRPIEQLTHRTEDILALARDQGIPGNSSLPGFLCAVTDRLEGLGEHLLRLRAIDITGDLASIDRFINECWTTTP